MRSCTGAGKGTCPVTPEPEKQSLGGIVARTCQKWHDSVSAIVDLASFCPTSKPADESQRHIGCDGLDFAKSSPFHSAPFQRRL